MRCLIWSKLQCCFVLLPFKAEESNHQQMHAFIKNRETREDTLLGKLYQVPLIRPAVSETDTGPNSCMVGVDEITEIWVALRESKRILWRLRGIARICANSNILLTDRRLSKSEICSRLMIEIRISCGRLHNSISGGSDVLLLVGILNFEAESSSRLNILVIFFFTPEKSNKSHVLMEANASEFHLKSNPNTFCG